MLLSSDLYDIDSDRIVHSLFKFRDLGANYDLWTAHLSSDLIH